MEPEVGISLVNDEQPVNTDNQISLANPTAAILPEEVMRERAEKAHFGLQGISPGADSLYNSIAVGDEDYARSAASLGIATKERDARLSMIQQVGNTSGPVTQDQVDLVNGLTREPEVNPNTVFEMAYGTQMVNKMILDKPDEGAVLNEAIKQDPNGSFDVFDLGSGVIAKQEIIRKRLQEVQARWKNAGTLETLGNVAELFIPGKSSLNQAGSLSLKAIALPGNTLEEKLSALWALPTDQFEAALTAESNRISDTNLIDGMDFLQQALGMSAGEKVAKNLFGLADVFDISSAAVAGVKIARGLTRAAGSAKRVAEATEEGKRVLRARAQNEAPATVPDQAKKAIADTVNANATIKEPERILSASGNTTEAADTKAIQKTMVEASEVPLSRGEDALRPLENVIPSIFKPRQIFDSAANLSNELAARIATSLEKNVGKFMDSLTNTAAVERLTPEALARAVENAKSEMRDFAQFNKMDDSVIDVVHNPRDPFTNTDSVSLRLGSFTAETFDSADQARVWAKDVYRLDDGSYTIGQQGTSFYIDVRKPISEAASDVQALLVTTQNKTPVPQNLATQFLAGVRSPSNVTSKLQKENRLAATFGMERSQDLVSEITKVFGTLGKREREDFSSILRVNRDFKDPVTGDRGMFYTSVSQLEDAYLTSHGRLPTARETEAYFTYVQLSDYDWMLRNFSMYRDKVRLGLKNYEIKAQLADAVGSESGQAFVIPKFEGKKEAFVPWNSDHLSIMVIDAKGSPKIITRNASGEDRAMVDSMIKEQGYDLVRVANPLERPFKTVTGSSEPIQYVVTKGAREEALNTKQINYRPGGHVEYKNPYWVKQPKLYQGQGGTWFYEGDTTAFNFSSRAQAEKFTERMDTARRLLLDGNEAGLEAYLKKNLPYSKESFKALFDKEKGYYDLNTKFHTLESGQRTVDFEKDFGKQSFRDLSKSDYTLTDAVDRKFAGQRDQQLKTISERGTDENPVFNMVDSELIDPLPALARGIGQITRNRFLGDMKASVADQFISEFGDLLTQPIDELRRYPMFYLHNPEFIQGADPARVAIAKATQANAINFVGHKGEIGKSVDQISEKILNTAYKFGGEELASKIADNGLLKARDPLSYFRGFAFHASLGMFNPVQWFVQANGLTHMLAISPSHAFPSMAAYSFQRALLLKESPEFLDHAARAMSKLGWKEGEFKEAFDTMRRAGWEKVGKETAYRDAISDPTLYQTTAGNILDKGTFFFKESEQMIRMSGWNVAYREFREANPKAVIGNRELNSIMARADTLTVNMTRAGKANWEKGIFSVPAQFSSYGIRMMEQFLGNQLTMAEKARAFALYSTLYGVPTAGGAAIGYPLYEDIKKAAIDYGWESDNKIIEAIMEGLPSAAISALFGKDVNFAQRYGPGGVMILRDLMDDDKTISDIVFGAAGSTVGGFVTSAAPVISGLRDVFLEDGPWEPVLQDFTELSRASSTLNSASRIASAMAVGKYFSKRGTYISDMSSEDSWIAGITGLQPRSITDAYLTSQSLNDLRDRQNEWEKEYVRWEHRAWSEASKGNYEIADSYRRRARAALVAGDFRPDQYPALLRKALREGSVSMVERIRTDFWKRAPGSQQKERFDRTLKAAEELTKGNTD